MDMIFVAILAALLLGSLGLVVACSTLERNK